MLPQPLREKSEVNMSATLALIFLKAPPIHAFRGMKQDKFAFVRATVGGVGATLIERTEKVVEVDA